MAVKQYKKWVMEQPGQMERIVRELEVGRSVTHPHLVRPITLLVDGFQNPALVMEYAEGPTLRGLLDDMSAAGQRLSFESATAIARQLSDALAALHAAGAVHRDVKPENIIVSEGGPVLMDLGVVSSDKFAEQTETGAFLGRIRYAAPEALFHGIQDAPADIYSLGAVIAELFTATRFRGGETTNWARLVVRAQGHDLPPVRGICSRFGVGPAWYAAIVLSKCLGVARSRASAAQLTEVLRQRPWEGEHHYADGWFRTGLPMVYTVVPPGKGMSLHDAVAAWRADCAPDMLQVIRDALASGFDSYPVRLDKHPGYNAYALGLAKNVEGRDPQEDDYGEMYAVLSEAGFTAYRLGLI